MKHRAKACRHKGCLLAHRCDINVAGVVGGETATLRLHNHHQPLKTHRKAEGRRRLTAQLADKSVVSASAADGGLRADIVGDELKDGAGVVVKSAHDMGIDGIFDAAFIKVLADSVKVVAAVVADKVEDGGCVGGNL